MPGGSSLFGTDVWASQPDNVGMHDGEPHAVSDEDINMVDGGHNARALSAWGAEGRPQGYNEAKRVAISNPLREEARDARAYAETQFAKAKLAAREKRLLEAQLATAQKEMQTMAEQMQARDEEWEAARQNWGKEWNQFTEQRDLEFKTQLADLTQKNLEQLQQQMHSELTARSAHTQQELENIAENHRRERETLLAEVEERNHLEQQKKQAEFDTQLAAFHARFSTQRRQATQNNGTNDVRFPDAPPPRTPQFISGSTREERRLETIIREGPGRFPVVSMTAPAESSAAPESSPTPEQNAGLLMNLDDPVVQQRLLGLFRESLGQRTAQKSPRKKRKNVTGAQTALIQARRGQQEELSATHDLRWKAVVRESWRLRTGLNRAKDFVNYQGVSEATANRCEAGETAPDASSYQLFFGIGWATSLWNKAVLDKSIQDVLQKRAEDPGHYDIPDVTEGYLKALFVNCLRDARTEWARHQPRVGETLDEARERAKTYELERRERSVGNSRKRNKLEVRRQTTETMMKVSLAKQDQDGAATWKWLRDDLLDELDVGGMSSEEDEPVEVHCGDQRMVTTAHKIKICPWRLAKVTEYVELIDNATQKRMTKPVQRRFRMRGQTRSTTDPPLKLARALYDTAWLAQQKTFIPDIEEQLEIAVSNLN
ncbi:hypothetical protein C8R44DRAFT_751344 [Mycena epipterygia]|nr:hypothetical protein C8R44DRAFT_751344 [Mycena epipterygia]